MIAGGGPFHFRVTMMRVSHVWTNPAARRWRGGEPVDCRDFHARLPGYAPTPLHSVPALAARLGVGAVVVKDESERLGLPAFKILGASWGAYRELSRRLGEPVEPWRDVAELRERFAPLRGLRLLTATDGNHGRAVARMARLLGLEAIVAIPSVVGAHVRAAIASEGAEVLTVQGDYDTAVAAAAELAAGDERHVLIQDTAWPGYTEIPGWIADGYQTLFAEIDEQLAAGGHGDASVVVVPTGVGSLLSAAVQHHRAPSRRTGTAVLAVEPDSAACVLESLRAGRPTTVATGTTVMEGLNCGTVSSAAWPALRAGLDAAIAITDADALAAVDELAAHGISAGPCGAAALAAFTGPPDQAVRRALALDAASTVVLINTEAAR
jgi:diaminopropionate ammonia-lyase